MNSKFVLWLFDTDLVIGWIYGNSEMKKYLKERYEKEIEK